MLYHGDDLHNTNLVMSDDIQFDSEPIVRLDDILEPYFSKYHRHRCFLGLLFHQGKRDMVQINVRADDLPTLLQAKPSKNNDPDSGKNRPEVKGHADEVKNYVLKRVKRDKPWILGTLTANVDPEKVQLYPLGRGLCFVVIPRGVKLDITDGQHRKRAVHDLIESSNGELIANNDFPITLVLEKDLNQCQTDFRDMAQTKSLQKSLLLSFGEFEGTIGITKNLIKSVPIFTGKTEKIQGSASAKKRLIFTSNYIAKLVSCAFTNDPNKDLLNLDFDSASQSLIDALNQFFYECKDTRKIYEISPEDLTVNEVADFIDNCLLGRSVGLEILGKLLYCAYNKDVEECHFDSEKVSKIADLDWSRSSYLWKDNVVLTDTKNPQKPYKITTGINAIRIATNQAKAALGWQ